VRLLSSRPLRLKFADQETASLAYAHIEEIDIKLPVLMVYGIIMQLLYHDTIQDHSADSCNSVLLPSYPNTG